MNREEIEKIAKEMGFITAWVDPSDILIKKEYLKYCEENRCGNYGANYACPPDCGTVEEMHEKLLSAKVGLVIQSNYDIPGYGTPEVAASKAEHTGNIHKLRDLLREKGMDVFAVGYGGCNLCKSCKRKENLPCVFPDRAISCLSAYCVDVATLCEKAGLSFEWNEKKLYLYGMIMFR